MTVRSIGDTRGIFRAIWEGGQRGSGSGRLASAGVTVCYDRMSVSTPDRALGLSVEGAGSRNQERLRRVRRTVFAAAVGRVVAVAGSLVSTAMILRHVGSIEYGFWAALLAFSGLLVIADLGLGYGLLNALAEALGRDNPIRARRLVSNGFWSLAFLACALILVLVFVMPFLPWESLFKANDGFVSSRHRMAALVLMVATLAGLPFSMWQRVASASQAGYLMPVWDALGSAISVSGTWSAVHCGGEFTALAAATAAGPLSVSIGGHLWYFGLVRPDLRPTRADLDLAYIRDLVVGGGGFLVLQLCGLALPAALSVLLLRLGGALEVTSYAVVGKLYQFAPQVAAFWFTALWPAYRDALTRNEIVWARRSFLKVTLIAALSTGLGCVILVPTAETLVRWWTGAAVGPILMLNLGLALSTLATVITTSVSTYLSASGYVNGQAWLALAQLVVSLGLAGILIPAQGAAGAAWATVGAYLVVVVPVQTVVILRTFRLQRGSLP